MKINFLLLVIFIFTMNFNVQAQKKPLDHSVYTKWKTINNQIISNNGLWIAYIIEPAKGDGFLYLLNTETGKLDSVARGKSPQFDTESSFLAFSIEPQHDSIRKMKLNKVPQAKMPKDTLGIFILAKDSLIKIPKIQSFKLADTLASFVIYESLQDKKIASPEKKKKGWWIFGKKKNKVTKAPEKKDGKNLVLFFPIENKRVSFDFIDDYIISKQGNLIALIDNNENKKQPKTTISLYDTRTMNLVQIYNGAGFARSFTIANSEEQWAFLLSKDTVEKSKVYSLYYGNHLKKDSVYSIADSTSGYRSLAYCPSEFFYPYFSKDNRKLFFGIASIPVVEPKDTLLEDEKYSVDVWSYHDDFLQPEQIRRKPMDLRQSYLSYFNCETHEIVQLEDEFAENIRLINSGNGNVALSSYDKKYRKFRSWDGYYADYYIVNMFDGSKEIFLERFDGEVQLSAAGSYAIYFKTTDSNWYSYDIEARKHTCLTCNLKEIFCDEQHDMPNPPNSYGVAGWFTNDKYVAISDRYDLWQFDPTGKTSPINLTNHYGRNNKIRLNVIRLNRDLRFINEEKTNYLYAFNEVTKESGVFKLDLENRGNPEKLTMSNHRYFSFDKPRNAEMMMWRRMNFNEYPELFTSDLNFNNIRTMTNVNPQQADYLWGNVELIKWQSYDGQMLEGLLYKPEDFDSTKKYPMIVYFYERYTDELHNHYIPKPSHSTINFTEYTSRGYIVFVPDVVYKKGEPAQSAYNAIVSGTEFLKKNTWVNSEKIGLQGQSWGGYQVAMLVTMTNIYACAEAGAPVANMTSAYGGIRWGSGMSRAFQYEKTQSRIGYTLWDSTELYIKNSPLFFADKVQTPLLIMHNDKDGAVPWYQGIEYFSALRRLDKKVWMLTYNNDDHNLNKWPNRVDLSIRMQQFFDYYLKDEPMPKWMAEGLPATLKGKVNNY